MESIINYFETIPSSHRSAILIGGITFFWLIESVVPLFHHQYSKWKHAGINFFFTLTTIVINFGLAFLLIGASQWVTTNEFGLLYLVEMPVWIQLVVGLLLLDFFGAYLAHYVEHKTPILWKFHVIHHTDQHVDTTTANRHHPGESVIRFVFTCLGVIIVGAPLWLVLLYQSLSVVLSQFNHANINFPAGLDRVLRWVVVTPNMHRVHHHYQLPLTDTNFGNIFSVWDRLLGTYAVADNKDLIYGVDTYMDEQEHQNIGTMLKIPFGPRRKPTLPE